MTVAEAVSVNRSSEFRPDDDHYPTPRSAAVPFIRAIPFPNKIWEPACGEGHLSRILDEYGYNVISQNLGDRGYGDTGKDFLLETKLPRGVQSIITNPPFALVNQFVRHAINLGPQMVAIFARLKFLEGRDRYGLLHRPNPPAFVYVFINRVTFYAGDTPTAEQPGWNTEAFAWFVWLRDWPHEPVIRWLRTDDGLQGNLFGETNNADQQPVQVLSE